MNASHTLRSLDADQVEAERDHDLRRPDETEPERFRLTLAPGYTPKAIGAPTLNASAPVRMTLTPR